MAVYRMRPIDSWVHENNTRARTPCAHWGPRVNGRLDHSSMTHTGHRLPPLSISSCLRQLSGWWLQQQEIAWETLYMVFCLFSFSVVQTPVGTNRTGPKKKIVFFFFVSGMEPKALCIPMRGKSSTFELVPIEFLQVILCTQKSSF